MRQYRGKTKDGEWLYGSLILSEDGSRAFIGHIRFWDDSMPVASYQEVIPATVGQSTGLKDTNGKEIFEGSLVKWTDSDGVVHIDDVKYGFAKFFLNNNRFSVYEYMSNELVVIGTSHDEDKKE